MTVPQANVGTLLGARGANINAIRMVSLGRRRPLIHCQGGHNLAARFPPSLMLNASRCQVIPVHNQLVTHMLHNIAIEGHHPHRETVTHASIQPTAVTLMHC